MQSPPHRFSITYFMHVGSYFTCDFSLVEFKGQIINLYVNSLTKLYINVWSINLVHGVILISCFLQRCQYRPTHITGPDPKLQVIPKRTE